MKKQDFKITVFDYRTRRKKIYRFTSHTKYLRAMKELANEPQTHVSERTETELHVYPADRVDLFEKGDDPLSDEPFAQPGGPS